jgi:lysozyme family protein
VIDQILDGLIAREGGYVNDPRDPGGETNWGITARVARMHGYDGPMKAMTREQAKTIYRQAYWTEPGFEAVSSVYPKVAEELFDTGVNMGQGVAVEFLQRLLNGLNNQGSLYPDIKVDGDLGPATMKALTAYRARRGPSGETVLLKGLNCLQGARYVAIAEGRSASEGFLYGWLANRVA